MIKYKKININLFALQYASPFGFPPFLIDPSSITSKLSINQQKIAFKINLYNLYRFRNKTHFKWLYNYLHL